MKLRFLFLALLAMPLVVQAEIYKKVDEDGHVTYSSAPAKGAKRLDLPPLPTMVPPARTNSSEDFPKVGRETQKERDDTRRRILEDELATEEQLLETARKDLTEVSPEVYKGADGKTYRNVAKYEEKVSALKEQVELHEKNVAALKSELSKLK